GRRTNETPRSPRIFSASALRNFGVDSSLPCISVPFIEGIIAMNRSTETVWNIRNLLTTAVALLSLLGLAVSGYFLPNASLERSTASEAASVNETADLLLASAGQWARE